MSAILFLGVKNALSKTEYNANEVFSDVRYPSSIFFRDGIAFDEDIFEQDRLRIGRYGTKYKWYEVKSNVMLFDYESKKREVCPDLYEASMQLSEWFIHFLSAQINNGNELYLLQRWLGDPPEKKIGRKTLNIGSLKPLDYDLPYDVLLKLSPM